MKTEFNNIFFQQTGNENDKPAYCCYISSCKDELGVVKYSKSLKDFRFFPTNPISFKGEWLREISKFMDQI